MKALKKTFLAAATTALLGFGSVAQAGVIIDLFDGVRQTVATATTGDIDSSQSGVNANVIGLYRDLSVEKLSGFEDDFGTSTLSSGGGRLSLSNDTGNTSRGVITWDGDNVAGDGGSNIDTTGLGGIDLTTQGANALLAAIIAADMGFDYKIRVWDMDGNTSTLSAAVQFHVVPAMGVTADYYYDWFNLDNGSHSRNGLNFTIDRTGTVDFSNIGALQLVLDNVNEISVDLSIGQIRAVPEPGALALVGAALFGVAAASRRRKA